MALVPLDQRPGAGAGADADTADAGAVLRREIAEGRLELPLLPNVAAEVLASSVDERADAQRLAGLIAQDQSLVGHVLRIVNSPAFRGAVEIVALQQATARLGMNRIREIALSASLKATLLRAGPYQAHVDQAWRVSLAAGLWAKELARAVRRNVEVAYLCGLLHDLGTPVVLHRLGQLDGTLDTAEVDALRGELSPAAAVRLARSWSLPEPVLAAIERGDDFAGAGPHADLVAVCSCAALLAQHMAQGDLEADEVALLPAVEHLNLYPDDVEELLACQAHIRSAVESMVV